MFSVIINLQSPSTSSGGLPDWLTSGSLPIIMVILVGFVLIYIWINFRLKRVQRDLHKLGRSYYEKEKVLLDDLNSDRITKSEYQRKHQELVNEMRRDSRKLTDGPQM